MSKALFLGQTVSFWIAFANVPLLFVADEEIEMANTGSVWFPVIRTQV